ncbi:MAG: cation diffusion facilitator CzcD-associated flavoprotein CzcO [Flavobacteriaceae bacterium]|jgi:cation diffusion facilitator CzcD-associated flavoprotein CzcO
MSTSKLNDIHDDSSIDIAIIGAGISGLFCVCRLITNED